MATPLSDIYQSLRDERPDASLLDISKAITRECDIDHISYVDFRKSADGGLGPTIYSTYAPEWVSRYEEQRYHLIDPVIDASLGGVLPVDWSEVSKVDQTSRNFFGEAAEFGVHSNGISIPIRDPAHGRGVLTLNSSLQNHEWRTYRKEMVADAMYLGCLIHSDLSPDSEGIEYQSPIGAREKEVLKWAAVGKTAWETAQIMKISNRTVNHHLYNALAKLDVTNKTHAVAKAIRNRLINL